MATIKINNLSCSSTEVESIDLSTGEETSAVNGGMMQVSFPWDYAAYGACFAGAWAGSWYGGNADPVGASDYCHDRFLK